MRAELAIIERTTRVAAAVAGLLCVASMGFSDTYVVTPLTNGLSGTPRDISPSGAVCGIDAGHAFVWRPTTPNATTGTVTILPSLISGFSSDAYGLNSSGFVVGRTGDNPLQQHEVPVVWNPDGSITKLPLFNGVTSGGLATGINESGQITGRNGLFISDAAPVSWNVDGTGSYIGNPPGSTDSYGWKINATGIIAGTAEGGATNRIFTYANGQFTFLPPLPGGTLSGAYDINDAGHVVGACNFGAATSFFYDGSAIHGLANVPGDLIQVATAQGLNNRDQIVGYGNPTPNITGALIWDSPSAVPSYLNGRIDPTSPGYVNPSNRGWIITEAVAINDLGQIAARGLSTGGGSYKALLLTPVHSVTGVDGRDGLRLAMSASPNPAHGPIGVEFTMPRPGPARLQIVDLAGRAVATLHDGPAAAGATRMLWDGRAADGRLVPPGLYFLHLQAPTGVVSQRLMVTR
jgi:uncharacterized membrane protein